MKFLYHKPRIKSVRVITMGIKKKFEHLGLGSLFYVENTKRMLERDYTSMEMSWIMEDNLLMNRVTRMLGGEIYKTYRVYKKAL